MDIEALTQTLAAAGEPPFRARQVWEWVARGAAGYEQMSNLPAALRKTLAREVPFSCLSLERRARSRDGTVKALLHTADGRPLEAVLMRYRDGRRSVCLSSQSGCPLTCSFCATGAMRFGRNLSASEILDQALCLLGFEREELSVFSQSGYDGGRRTDGGRLTNCVFMGMGEPLMNVENVLAACERLPDIGIGHRQITVSTVGWIPGLERLAQQPMPLRLALSLHAADEALRSELMPVNERYPLRDVIEACRAYYDRRRRRVFTEYVMLAGINDRYEQALALARLLRSVPNRRGESIFKVNLIPYNPMPATAAAPFRGSSREAIDAFRAALAERGIPVTVRLTRGRDIAAACGQLAATAES